MTTATRTSLSCGILAVLMGWVLLPQPAPAQSEIVEQAKRDVSVLTADSLFGRGYQYGGVDRAARYIRREFRSIGVEPVGGGYFHRFELTVDLVDKTPVLIVNGDSLAAGRDFVPHGVTGSGQIRGTDRIVSLGSGLLLPSNDLNPYASVDVRGAVVVIDEAVPDSIRSDTNLTREDRSILTHIAYAARAGAAGVIVRSDRLVYAVYPYDLQIPVLTVRRASWPGTPENLSLSVELTPDARLETQNVLGRIPGRTRPDSVIILSAHYDHVGSLGREIVFPGANDNASGTAMLLALARHFRQHPHPYTIVFAAFSGEELGLLGSEHFAEHPPFDLSRVTFLLNFDMVASGTNGIMAVGGKTFPGAFERLAAAHDSLGLGPLAARANARNSDHYPLTQQGIRGFFLYTRGGEQPYHHVDDVPETLDWGAWMEMHTLAVHFLHGVGRTFR